MHLAATEIFTLFAGIAWNPGLRGALSVLVGVVVLMGSIYLILATNTGARLGMLLALAGLSGWLVILTFYWTVSPPAIGPTGPLPTWEPVEIIYNSDGVDPATEVADSLPQPEAVAAIRDDILANNPEVAEAFANTPSLSEIASENPGLVEDAALGGWSVVAGTEAGEAQAAADAVLVEEGVFSATSDYVKLEVFEIGGKPDRDDVPDDEWYEEAWTRIRYKVETTVFWKHPPHYAVVEVQAVTPQETRPGEAPPRPEADPDAPVISVVLVRDLGNQRGTPGLYFVISLSFFVIFTLMLHFRDKTLDKNLAAAEPATKA
jgi:hypothetical protein